MRVLILNDRVHKKTGAVNLLKSLCDGIAPPHEISWVNIHELSMQPCEGCLKCRLKWLHYPGHTNSGIMPDNGGVSYEFKLLVPIQARCRQVGS